MKKRAPTTRHSRNRKVEAVRKSDQPRRRARGGATESKPSRETFPERTRKPGDVGLANEMRPGLGTRATTNTATKRNENTRVNRKPPARHDAEPLGRDAPLPPAKPRRAPREEPADAFAQQQERDTGVSGHTSGD